MHFWLFLYLMNFKYDLLNFIEYSLLNNSKNNNNNKIEYRNVSRLTVIIIKRSSVLSTALWPLKSKNFVLLKYRNTLPISGLFLFERQFNETVLFKIRFRSNFKSATFKNSCLRYTAEHKPFYTIFHFLKFPYSFSLCLIIITVTFMSFQKCWNMKYILKTFSRIFSFLNSLLKLQNFRYYQYVFQRYRF